MPRNHRAKTTRIETINMSEAMDIQEILEYLPHRYPFLLIDRVLAIEPGRSLTGLKNVSFNEAFFLGHFPQRPIMPGVLILEALAQATGVLAFKSEGGKPDHRSMYYLVGVDDVARTLTTAELPIGILTALVGAPVFALLLRRRALGWA